MFLPDELFIEILLRLPVKSLLRFKSVSKSWLSFISKPHFARLHFDLAAARNDKLLIIDPSAPETETTSVDLDASLHDDSAFTTIKTSFQLPKYSYNGQIMGSCRGFLLVWDQHLRSGLYLWNPSTSVHKQLPRSPILSPYLYGFGYDPSTDDYLVVLADYRTDEVWGSQFVLFSMRANSWERIEDTCLPYITNCDEATSGSLLNGALHWLVKSCDVDVIGDVIVAFDLVERSFSEIPLPHYNDDDFFYSHLWVHGGLLSLCVGHVNDAAEIWVMEEYKVHSSWTKSIVLDTPDVYFLPIYSTKSGDIIGKGGMTRLVKCNAKGELLEDRLYPLRSDLEEALITYIDAGIHEYIRLRAAVYTETLHSLPGDDSGQEEDE